MRASNSTKAAAISGATAVATIRQSLPKEDHRTTLAVENPTPARERVKRIAGRISEICRRHAAIAQSAGSTPISAAKRAAALGSGPLSKQGLLFLKKKKQKDFILLRLVQSIQHARQQIKVFWFFFSK
jgi:hypothetical protein